MSKSKLKKVLRERTRCEMQHDWRPCGTCFMAISEELTNQDRQAVLLTRWDYTREELDNLPEDIDKSIDKVIELAKKF